VSDYPVKRLGRDYPVVLLALVAMGVYCLARWGGSTALQIIGLGMLAAAWLSRLFSARRMGGLVCLIGLICLPLSFLQGNLLLLLQRLAAEMASWLLDFGAVAHLRQGVVLESGRGSLFVEEACSGMQSLLTGLVVAQIYFCWYRKGLVFSLVGLVCCSGFLLLGNSLRIFFIAWLYIAHGIDWTKGWLHELSGLTVYLFVLALLPSLRVLLEWIFSRFTGWWSPWKSMRDETPGGLPETAGSGYKPLAALLILLGLVSLPLRLALCGMLLAGVGEVVFLKEPKVAAGPIDTRGLPRLAAIDLPAELAGWRKDPGASEVSVIEKFALDQHVWTFHKGTATAWVAADLPYDHLHPLRDCYINRDWVIKREGSTAIGTGGKFSYLELLSKEGARQPMLVCYDNYDLKSRRYVGGPPDRIASRWSMLSERLKGERAKAPESEGPYCQVQVVQAGVTGFDSPEGVQAVELLNAARDYLAGQLLITPDR
jgi:exosortase